MAEIRTLPVKRKLGGDDDTTDKRQLKDTERRRTNAPDWQGDYLFEQEKQLNEQQLRIHELEEIVEEQEAALLLSAKLPELDNSGADVFKELEEARARIQQLSEQIHALNASPPECTASTAFETPAKRSDAAAEKLETDVAGYDAIIESLRAELAAQIKAGSTLRNDIAQRDATIKSLRGQISQAAKSPCSQNIAQRISSEVKAARAAAEKQLLAKIQGEMTAARSNASHTNAALVQATEVQPSDVMNGIMHEKKRAPEKIEAYLAALIEQAKAHPGAVEPPVDGMPKDSMKPISEQDAHTSKQNAATVRRPDGKAESETLEGQRNDQSKLLNPTKLTKEQEEHVGKRISKEVRHSREAAEKSIASQMQGEIAAANERAKAAEEALESLQAVMSRATQL